MLACCRALGGERLATIEQPGRRAVLIGWTRAPVGGDGVSAEHDVIGVGIGPFNLGLAALLDGVARRRRPLLRRTRAVRLASGMLLADVEVQVPFLADLVTLADPTSPHSFLAYLHDCGRLYRFYFHERWHVLRREFDAYYRWVAARLARLRFGARVEAVRPRPGGGWSVDARRRREHRARAVVLGVGSVPAVPAAPPGCSATASCTPATTPRSARGRWRRAA